MAGMSWWPLSRITPADGAAATTDWLNDLELRLGPLSLGLRYELETEERHDINRSLRPILYGFRPRLTVVFEAYGEMLDGTHLAQLLTSLADPTATVELSLDGGTTWRQVTLTEFAGPTPVRNKLAAGARYELELAGVELIAELPDAGAGAW